MSRTLEPVRPISNPAPGLANLELAPPDTVIVMRWRKQIPDDLWALTLAWLGSKRSANTRRGYIRDISIWFDWCADASVNALQARAAHASLFHNFLEVERMDAKRTRARRMAAVSSWFDYLERNEIVGRNPFKKAERPTVDPQASVALSHRQVDAWLGVVAGEPPRNRAFLRTLYLNGLRVGSLLAALVSQYGEDSGYRVLRLNVKGGHELVVPLQPPAFEAIDEHLAERGNPTDGPLIATKTGKPLTYTYAVALVRRTLRIAGVPGAGALTPHTLRRTAITELLDAGEPLHVVQDFADHARPETTRLYDAARKSLARHPGSRLVASHATVLSLGGVDAG